MERIGGRIKYYRKLNNLRQKDIYEKIGIDKTTYIRYESNSETNMHIEICNKICTAIGIDPSLVYDDYMKFIASDYSSIIRSFRKKHKLTHEKFGKLLKMDPKISARWERRVCEPSKTSYIKIKKLFKKYGKKYNILNILILVETGEVE